MLASSQRLQPLPPHLLPSAQAWCLVCVLENKYPAQIPLWDPQECCVPNRVLELSLGTGFLLPIRRGETPRPLKKPQ